jgi:hypothetical protein
MLELFGDISTLNGIVGASSCGGWRGILLFCSACHNTDTRRASKQTQAEILASMRLPCFKISD